MFWNNLSLVLNGVWRFSPLLKNYVKGVRNLLTFRARRQTVLNDLWPWSPRSVRGAPKIRLKTYTHYFHSKNICEFHNLSSYWLLLEPCFVISTTHGQLKYPTLAKLIKSVLIIPHGNADVKRGFSINENMVTQNRSKLSNSSINGLRST